MTAALLLVAVATAVLIGRLYEARDRSRVPGWARSVTARDLRRMLGETGFRAAWRRFVAAVSGPLFDATLILAGGAVLTPILFVWLYPVFAPRHPHAGKFTLRAGPIVEVRR